MKTKQGISLIVLVITIIVIVILAGTIVLTLSNNGIIDKATDAIDRTNLETVRELAQVAWGEAYLNTDKSQKNLEEYVINKLEEKIDIDNYVIKVTTKGVTVIKNWLSGTVDSVPIPKGFVASSATGENTKNGGLVIYEGTEAVTDANVDTARRTRNQYVWIPVEDFSKFVRESYDNTELSNTLGEGYWEVVLDTTTNMPLAIQDTKYVTSTTLTEVQEMYESVKEYKGFYIARYEAGIDTQRTSNTTLVKGMKVYSMMNKIPYDNIPWGESMLDDTNGVVGVARSIYQKTNVNYGVVSTLTYGVQWDRILAWWLEVGAKDGNGNIITTLTDSTKYGNYVTHVIAKGDLNDGAKYAVFDLSTMKLGTYNSATINSTKSSGTYWQLTTGALKVAKVNNIYDMAGNQREWSMEGVGGNGRGMRGGDFSNPGELTPVSEHGGFYYGVTGGFGFRTALYIKK